MLVLFIVYVNLLYYHPYYLNYPYQSSLSKVLVTLMYAGIDIDDVLMRRLVKDEDIRSLALMFCLCQHHAYLHAIDVDFVNTFLAAKPAHRSLLFNEVRFSDDPSGEKKAPYQYALVCLFKKFRIKMTN